MANFATWLDTVSRDWNNLCHDIRMPLSSTLLFLLTSLITALTQQGLIPTLSKARNAAREGGRPDYWNFGNKSPMSNGRTLSQAQPPPRLACYFMEREEREREGVSNTVLLWYNVTKYIALL